MSYPKFIITSTGWLRMGMVRLHKELLQPGEACWGGGYYEIDYAAGMIRLSGESADFGRPRWERLSQLKVDALYSGMPIVYAGGFCVNAELDVQYVTD